MFRKCSGDAAQWEEEEKKTRGRFFTGLGNRIHEAATTLVGTPVKETQVRKEEEIAQSC